MQTFLPYPDFDRSAQVLDVKRLGKQRVEVIQIVRALTVPGYAWASHPAVLMWKGYEEALGTYGLACCDAWLALGFDDTCALTIAADLAAAGVERLRSQTELTANGQLPWWLGDEELHRSHQSSLVRKDVEHYGPLFPGVPADLEYVWPVRSEKVLEAERRKAASALARAERERLRVEREAVRARKRRSDAAKKAWAGRRRNAS